MGNPVRYLTVDGPRTWKLPLHESSPQPSRCIKKRTLIAETLKGFRPCGVAIRVIMPFLDPKVDTKPAKDVKNLGQ